MAPRKNAHLRRDGPPNENQRSTTARRLIDHALRRGYNVNVFAYEGAVNLVKDDPKHSGR